MSPTLPPGVTVIERGWLSANNILFDGPEGTALVDSGYFSHATQTVALVRQALGGRPLDRLLNTHLHSDHCGGNAALQAAYPALQTLVPPGSAQAVRDWDTHRLTYATTGQLCPRFRLDEVLQPGQPLRLGGLDWQAHAAPGHDPDSVILFQPDHHLLVSADALWENGFGVVFPELEGVDAYDEVGQTLDLIESLQPHTIIPGHGRVFGDVAGALARARSRLAQFVATPDKHTRHAVKVLVKFKLLELQRVPLAELCAWAQATPYLSNLHARSSQAPFDGWLLGLFDELVRAGAAAREGELALNVG
jgi:glyoxylase-like metal-dependent hydrolase (beta-lactamase superfamily II)